MTKGQIQKVKTMYQIGISVSEIAKTFGISENKVYFICKGVKRL